MPTAYPGLGTPARIPSFAVASILSHPFRFTADGRVATVDQASPIADAEQIAVLALTRLGERPLVPGFGMADPTFAGFETSALAAGLALWGPPVTVDRIDVTAVDDTSQLVQVAFR